MGTSGIHQTVHDEAKDLTAEELVAELETYMMQIADEHSDAFGLIDLDRIEWRVSRQLFRAGGYCETQFTGEQRHEITISYPAYQVWGLERTKGIARHELVHVLVHEEFGDSVATHGPEFEAVARTLDAPIRGERPLPYRFVLSCSHCSRRVAGLYRPSRRTRRPLDHRSECCDAPLEVEEHQRPY